MANSNSYEYSTKYSGVRVRGNSIQIDFVYKGLRCRETLSKIGSTASSIKKANDLLRSIHFKISFSSFNYADFFPNSKNVKLFGGGPASNMNISEAIDWWWQRDKHSYRKNTVKAYENDIKNHIEPDIGEIKLSDITPSQIKDWINSKDLSSSSKNNILIPMRKMFADAYSEGFINENLMKRIHNVKKKTIIQNPFKPSEVDAILNKMENPIKAFYQFSFWTGLSTGEQLGLKWKDIDFETCTFYVRRQIAGGKHLEETKNKTRNRKIELLEPSYQALLKIIPDDFFENRSKYDEEWVFLDPKTNSYWKLNAIVKPWRNVLELLKLEYRRPYNTRHTFASIMVTACLPDGWIRRQMGHATMRMLEEVYGCWMDDAGNVTDWVKEKTQNGHNGARFVELFLNKQ